MCLEGLVGVFNNFPASPAMKLCSNKRGKVVMGKICRVAMHLKFSAYFEIFLLFAVHNHKKNVHLSRWDSSWAMWLWSLKEVRSFVAMEGDGSRTEFTKCTQVFSTPVYVTGQAGVSIVHFVCYYSVSLLMSIFRKRRWFTQTYIPLRESC